MFPARSAVRRVAFAVSAVAVAAATLAGCSSAGSPSAANAGTDSISYALPPDFTPNWILPIGAPGKLNTNNGSIAASLWEPLVAYDGSTGSVDWHKDASIASDVKFNAQGTAATVTLANRHWSDGKPVTSRDVEFWFNLIEADKKNWGNYNPGQAPDNWSKLTVVDDTHFTIAFDKAYNTDWMLANQLSLITPLPQHVWDKTSDSDEPGDYDETPAGAVKVWDYLNKAAADISHYASSPLWKVVDGPYTVSRFTTAGNVTLSANAKYDGGDKAQIATVNLLPFTSADAEENAVRAGEVDYGYIQPTSMAQKASFESRGYRVEPWTGWAITYFPYNFNNPTMGPVFKQLYARRAIQESVDQDSLVKGIFNGTATAGYGPIRSRRPRTSSRRPSRTTPIRSRTRTPRSCSPTTGGSPDRTASWCVSTPARAPASAVPGCRQGPSSRCKC